MTPVSRLLRLFFFVVLLLLAAKSTDIVRPEAAKLPDGEAAALKAVATKLGKKGWNFAVDPCSRSGGWIDSKNNNVTCNCSYANGTVCHVVSIKLEEQNLAGVLPEELSKLTHLSELVLSTNRLSGQIPKELGNISTLEKLGLEANLLEGPLPPELGNLARMQRMYLTSNNFTGELPPALAKLTNLIYFWISGSNFTGKIPDFIRNWTQLQNLMIMGTNMEGPIPSSLSVLENITHLRISDLQGPGSSFPPLKNMKNLKRLILRNCKLSGELPSYIWSMTKLTHLDLSFNSLTGHVPASLSIEANLNEMFLRNNNFTGMVPQWIYSSKNNLDLSVNNFTGNAPSSCPQRNLNLVSSFSSTDNFVNSCFRKDYPCSEIAKHSSLFINCGGNQYNDNENKYEADPTPLGESTYYLSTERNWALTSTGAFMDMNTTGAPLSYIIANKSRLSMNDPTLYMTARTSPMAMTYYGLCLQSGSYSVSLHFAEIIFTDDQTFSSLGERVFDVSIQNEKVLENFNIAREAGGPGKKIIKSFNVNVTKNTLEVSLYWAGKGTIVIPTRGVYGPLISAISVTPKFKPEDHSEAGTRNEPSVVVIVLIVLFVCLIIFLILVILRIKGYLGGRETVDEDLRVLQLQTGYFSLKQIKAATRNFHPENKIGEGGFGPVYKGVLADGTAIAVKKLSSKSKQGNREFLNEVGMISALQHPNLVKLFGCCIEDKELMLIYEYMENNSLAHALFGPCEHQLILDWPTRQKICIGVARGLAYLHEESTLKIVHRDIKATNILLDKDLNAKISDFGLARLDEGDKTHISTRIAGTLGYLAPEYATRGHLTDKADVFSFGVVALEIVTGRSNAHAMPKEDFVFLLDWAFFLQEKGSLWELVDPRLGSDLSEDQALRMLNIALLCTSPSPSLRPTMSSVVEMLEGRILARAPTLSSTLGKASLSSAWRSSNPYLSSNLKDQ
ncbi:probable LRR receptor-like serine/threonine-protein kinase At1g53430 isoform X2 [Nymphaea colorata]|uniref:probable LRR receptor-like serine/threonine-protein kinase At1g53430 isoform X2 n=1 Tax=Nymphaea colorata TaxID=210225 RepID=UPI00129DA752|nr:probable LRR receptor-like serine/threonine-protein kinase At1g53430 isoform X2 [Nymphaea colorata]